MKEHPIKYNWIVKESEQKITCNLPWELSLYGHQQTQTYQPCTTDDQYKAKTVAMDAFVYGFLKPISQQYKTCPGVLLNWEIYKCYTRLDLFPNLTIVSISFQKLTILPSNNFFSKY